MTEQINLSELDILNEKYKDIRNAIVQKKDVSEQYVILAEYFLQNYKIKTNWFTKEIYIYKEGIFELNGECFLQQEVQHIMPAWKRSAKAEVIDKIMVNTYFVDNIFNKQNIIVVENGVILLDALSIGHENFFVPFSPDFLATKKLHVRFDPSALCPKIDAFLHDVGSYEDISYPTGPYEKKYRPAFETYLIEILADILNNHYKSQKGHIFIGDGENGKGTFMRIIVAMVGLENKTALGLEYIQEGGFQVYTLQNSMVNIIGDSNDKYVRDTGLVKKIIGEDYISANIKNVKKPLEFINTAKIILGGQHVMKSGEDSWAWYRRFIITDWLFKVSENEKNEAFEKELHEPGELSGLLNRILEQYKIFSANKFKYSMQSNLSEEDIRQNHLLKSNPVKLFIETQIIFTSDEESILKKDIYEAYCQWQQEHNAKQKSENYFHKEFRKELPDIPIKQINRKRHYMGITIKANDSLSNLNLYGLENQKMSYKDKILDLLHHARDQMLLNEDLFRLLFDNNYRDNEQIRFALDSLLQNGYLYEPRPDYFKVF